MATLVPSPKMQFLDSNGNPLSGGKLYSYAAGTSTPLATYTDSGGGTPNANPVILDSRGEASVWVGSSLYKFVLKTSDDVQIWSADNVGGQATLADLASETASTLAMLADSGGSALIGFIQSGTGADARTVQGKLREFVSLFDYMTSAQIADVQAGTALVDCTAAIQEALDAAQSGGFGGVYAPPGTYLTGKINWPGNNLTLRGAGSGYAYNSNATPRTIFKAKAATTIVFDLVQTGAAEDRTGNHLVDFKVDGNSIATYGIECAGANIIERVTITGCTSGGLHLATYTNSTRVKSCGLISNSGYGLYVDGSATTTYSVEDTNMALNTSGGALIYAGVVVSFKRCVFESNTGAGLTIYKADAHTGAFNGLSFEDCWFEDNASTGDYAISISAQTLDEAHAPDHIEFRNCRISASVATRKYLYAPCCKDVSFVNCQFDVSTASDAVFFTAESRRVSFIECANGVASGITATQMDNAIAQGTQCWWHTRNVQRVVGAGSPAAAFENSWVNFGGAYATAKYWFDLDGRVCIEGSVKNGTAANVTIFTLPVGYRPSASKVFAVDGNSAHAQAIISSAGTVVINAGGSTTFQSLNGISFIPG